MSELHRHRILQHLVHPHYHPVPRRQLAEALGINPADLSLFDQAVDELVAERQVVLGTGGAVGLPPIGDELTGRIRITDAGFGFVRPESVNAHGDLFVPAGRTGDALNGDRVRARVLRDRQRGPGTSPWIGQVVEILQRASATCVGTLEKRGNQYLVHPDGKAFKEPVVVRDPHARNAAPGHKVVVELTRYPESGSLAEGVITEVLGEPGRPDVETSGVMRTYGLPEEFPAPVLEQTRDLVRRYNENPQAWLEGRTDLRSQFILTIDPPDAKDFDDAISIEKTSDGYELGVHIADVAAFVEAGTLLDLEAQKRGNSVYLPRRVIPMLPEVLSNGICSLQPRVDRLTRSVFIRYDDQGRVLQRRFARSVICSAHRLTYLEAQALIDGNEEEARRHSRTEDPYTPELHAALAQMNKLARIIRGRRMKAGMIVLDLPEVELVYDESGRVVDAHPEDDAFTHKLIEAFMVEANEAVAHVFADLSVPLIRRIHPDPATFDLAELRAFAKVAGYHVPQRPTRQQLQSLLEAVRGKPAARAVHFAVLKTLTKAEYAPLLIGHFALASEHYTHYTSPIRRYVDLTVHRALDLLAEHLGSGGHVPRAPHQRRRVSQKMLTDERQPALDSLREVAAHCSATEINAAAAERELRQVLCLQLMHKHVGDVFDGTVTGVISRGLFIQIDKFLVEGLVPVGELPGSPQVRWRFHKPLAAMVADGSGRTIGIGRAFRVKIIRVDLERREMDLAILDEKPVPGESRLRKPPAPLARQIRRHKPGRSSGVRTAKTGKPRHRK